MDINARDLSDPEILQAGETPRGSFVEVAVARGGEVGSFRFAVSVAGRNVVEKILATHPFASASALPYRYFYAGQGGFGAPITHLLYVRIERGSEERTIELVAPEDLVTALQWFRQLPSLMAAAHLRAPA